MISDTRSQQNEMPSSYANLNPSTSYATTTAVDDDVDVDDVAANIIRNVVTSVVGNIVYRHDDDFVVDDDANVANVDEIYGYGLTNVDGGSGGGSSGGGSGGGSGGSGSSCIVAAVGCNGDMISGVDAVVCELVDPVKVQKKKIHINSNVCSGGSSSGSSGSSSGSGGSGGSGTLPLQGQAEPVPRKGRSTLLAHQAVKSKIGGKRPNDTDDDIDHVTKISRLSAKIMAPTTHRTKARVETLEDFDYKRLVKTKSTNSYRFSSTSYNNVKSVMGCVYGVSIQDFKKKAEECGKYELTKHIVHPWSSLLTVSEYADKITFMKTVPAFMYLEWVRETSTLCSEVPTGYCACCFDHHTRKKCDYLKYKNVFVNSMATTLNELILSCKDYLDDLKREKNVESEIIKYKRILCNIKDRKTFCRGLYYSTVR